MEDIQLVLHNDFIGQVLEFVADNGDVVEVAELEADLALSQKVRIGLSDGGTSSLTIKARIVGEASPQDERLRSFVLEDACDLD